MDAACDVASPQHGVIPDAYCLGSHGFLLPRKICTQLATMAFRKLAGAEQARI